MEKTFETLARVQHQIGGGVVYLECEDEPKLLEFYQNSQNHFKVFDVRDSESENITYKQLFRFFWTEMYDKLFWGQDDAAKQNPVPFSFIIASYNRLRQDFIRRGVIVQKAHRTRENWT